MEHRERINQILGKNNVDFILSECKNGKIADSELQQIALNMKVYGVYKEKRVSEKQTQDYTLLMMLECWWKECLYRPGIDGVEQLIKILEDSNLNYLVEEMKEYDQQVPKFLKYRCI